MRTRRLDPVSEFDYRPQPGFLSEWQLCVSGYDDPDLNLNGDLDILPPWELAEVEVQIRAWEDEYVEETGATLLRVHGAWGWREFEYDNDAVHRFEWRHELIDMRCPRCMRPEIADLYIVTDELWTASGFESHECWRCLEEVIGRRLVPSDFQPGVPVNTDESLHSEELRARIGLP